MKNTIVAAVLFSACVCAAASQPAMPSDKEIQQAGAKGRQLFSDTVQKLDEKTLQEVKEKTAKAFADSNRQGYTGTDLKNINMQIPKDAGIFNEIENFKKKTSKDQNQEGLLVFVSFNLDEGYLQELGDEVERAGGVLLIRGLVGDKLRTTVEKMVGVFGLTEKSTLKVSIDPKSFTRYSVNKVPAFVVTKEDKSKMCKDTSACADLPMPHSKVAGKVSLDYALGTIARLDEAFSPLAEEYLVKLRDSAMQE